MPLKNREINLKRPDQPRISKLFFHLCQTLTHCVRPTPRLFRVRSQDPFPYGGRRRLHFLAFEGRLQLEVELQALCLG